MPVLGAGGAVEAVAGSTRDITDRRQAAAELARLREEERESARQKQTILESITEGFVAVDSEWRFSYVNAPAERMYGMGREELIGKDFWQVFPEALGTVFEREYRRAMADRTLARVEARFDRLNGWFEVNVFPVSDGGLSFYFRDITERKRAEEATERRASSSRSSPRSRPASTRPTTSTPSSAS